MQKQRIKFLLTACAGGLIGLMSFIQLAHAETVVPAVNNDAACCSSVLFIPGIEGSRLYSDLAHSSIGSIVGIDTVTRRYWEPLNNNDAARLYSGLNGVSIDQSIYSGKPIDKALGIVDIYGKFMNFLDGLKNEKIINEWQAFGYDWRHPIDEVVMGTEIKATTTESLVQTFLKMAEKSKTGKVTVIAHSNGGLVTKYLTKRLSEIGMANLIDGVISVAVPYLGTPEAIAALLHGDHQSIGGGFILNSLRARIMGMNMPSAYSLLPSKEYFSKVFSPTIAFASSNVKNVNNGLIPKEIASYNEQFKFITDSEKTRSRDYIQNTSVPIKGNSMLLTAAESLHGVLDAFYWPSNIARWAIAGWNKTTTKGIVYDEKAVCNAISCSTFTIHSASTTIMGDGSVVTPSAVYNAGKVVSMDLEDISQMEGRDIAHSNILGASSTLAVIKNIITHKKDEVSGDQEVVDKISQIPGVTIGEPDYSKQPSFLVLSTHSPVELHVYDSKGNHTGIIPKPAGLEDVVDGLYTFFDQKIIGSKFTKVGGSEEEPEYQIYLPDNNGEKYSVVLNGTGLGQFTFDTERVRNGSFVEKVEFAAMPVTPLTIATTTVLAAGENGETGMPLASTTKILNIDIDGNGLSDINATTQTKISSKDYLELLKGIVSGLLGGTPKGKNVLGRIDKLEELIASGKIVEAHGASLKLNSWVSHINRRTLTEKEKTQITEMIDLYISQYE